MMVNRINGSKKRCTIKQNYWSAGEVDMLEYLYPNTDVSIEEMLKALPNRSYSSIYSKANSLGLPLRSDSMQDGLEKIMRERE